MTLEQAIAKLKWHYKRGLSLDYVRKPLAWALFKTWKEADKEKQK